MAKRHGQGVTEEQLASYEQQCAALGEVWRRLGALLQAAQSSGGGRESLEAEYLAIRSALACDFPILTYWRQGGYGLTAGINRLTAGAPTLEDLAGSGRAAEGWRGVRQSLDRIEAALLEARRALAAGRPAALPPELIQHDTPVAFPVRRILRAAGIVAAVLLALGTAYFLRNFLGVWAPGAGEGLAVTEGMSDEEQIDAVLRTMSRAFEENSVDLFMTLIANDFRDEKGNGRRALRVALQAVKESGVFGQVRLDTSRMRITPRGDVLDVRPLYIETPDDRITIHVGFRPYRGKLLIATGSST
ncbi:MAG: hypothetical protein KF886_07690 [Candidatus Hydrogenedentes bacterium]|nr:hypothetical protein [Candidatus Hydrogenedentota bacterium]